jgi:oxygen-independent coproporphyrinogen-3 oxidase
MHSQRLSIQRDVAHQPGRPDIGVGPADAPRALQQRLLDGLSARPDGMIGLALALPFCAMHCLCCERDIQAGRPPEVLLAYAQYLGHEARLLASMIGTGQELMQLHLGGGSANLVPPTALAQLMHGLRRCWRIPDDAALTVECDPRRTSAGQMDLLRGLGFGEVQFGVLDLAPAVQRAIGRLQSAALVDDACTVARDCGIPLVHLELMVGLPEQTPATWRHTLQQIIAMAPARISLRRYRHRPWLAPGQFTIDAHALPDAAAMRDLVALSADELGAVGYRWLGAGMFVLEDDPLSLAADDGVLGVGVHGLSAVPALPVLGLGRGATSDVDGCLLWNQPRSDAWMADVAGGRLPVAQGWRADRSARRRRAAAAHLLCQQQLPAALLDGDLAPIYGALAEQAPPGSLHRLPDRLVLTAPGRLHLPELCAALAGLPAGLPDGLSAALPDWLA